MFSLITHFINAQIRTDTCIENKRETTDDVSISRGHRRWEPFTQADVGDHRDWHMATCARRHANTHNFLVFILVGVELSTRASSSPCPHKILSSLHYFPALYWLYRCYTPDSGNQTWVITKSRSATFFSYLILLIQYFHVLTTTCVCHCNCQPGSQAQIHQQ